MPNILTQGLGIELRSPCLCGGYFTQQATPQLLGADLTSALLKVFLYKGLVSSFLETLVSDMSYTPIYLWINMGIIILGDHDICLLFPSAFLVSLGRGREGRQCLVPL